jgi:site-specific DNA recombinase
MRAYCLRKGYVIGKEYSFDESAYKKKRDEFDRLLEEVNAHSEKLAVCFDKVDRLSRDVFDKRVGVLYEKALTGKIEIHFVSDGQVIDTNMSAVENFQFSMSLGLAKYYSDAISDNTKRAFEQKRRSGEWTGSVPFGYAPVALNAEKRLRADIVPDPLIAGYVKQMYEMYATGRHSNSTIRDYLKEREVRTRRGKYLTTSAVYWILTNSFYYGVAYSKKYKESYSHRYEPLISKELFDGVQSVLRGKNQNQNHARKAINPFTGLLKCGICGCSVCREIKRGKPYHACSNAKKLHVRSYIQEAVLLDQLRPLFNKLILTDEQIDQIVSSIRENHEYKAKYYKEQIESLNREFDDTQSQKDKLLDLLIGSNISQSQYDEKYMKLDAKQERILTDRAMYSGADKDYHVTAKYILGIARRAGELFECANDEEKNELLKLVLSNATLNGKNLVFTIRKPFDTIVNVKGFPVGLPQLDELRTLNWNQIGKEVKEVLENSSLNINFQKYLSLLS